MVIGGSEQTVLGNVSGLFMVAQCQCTQAFSGRGPATSYILNEMGRGGAQWRVHHFGRRKRDEKREDSKELLLSEAGK